MPPQIKLKLLRLILLFSGFAWAVSVAGVFLPWKDAASLLEGLGAKSIEYDPMLDYWLRMASGAFTLVGLVFIALAWNPRRWAIMIPFFGWIMVLEGVILLCHGWRLHLPLFPFMADVSACLFAGIGILWLKNEALNPTPES